MATAHQVSGPKIREARLRAGLTQAQLARAVSTSERNIVRWENAQNAPRMEAVAAIAEATGRDLEDFLVADSSEADDEETDLAAFLIHALRSYQSKPKGERQAVEA
jgi:transcriptional regulator with XRE-family HTH domain